jgi:transposase
VHYLGLDVHKETIAVSIAPQNRTEVRRYGIIGGSLDAVDKLLKKLARQDVELRVVYEAGPCRFVLCRHLRSQGIHCELVSPSLIPRKASDRVKTDRRDGDQLARLYPASELSPIHIPTRRMKPSAI